MNANQTVIVLTTFPDAEKARAISHTLVEERLVACANIVPQITSVYRWKDALETAAEVLVFYKTTVRCWEAVCRRLRDLHPYEVPEILRLETAAGLPAYVQWVADNCQPPEA